MIKAALACLCLGWTLMASAQSLSASDSQAQGAQLEARRQALEEAYAQETRLCYQQFNVTGCRLQARERRIEAHELLRKDELAHKDRERMVKADEVRQRLAERSASLQQDQDNQRAQALKDAQDRAQRQDEKLSEHAAKGGQRETYEKKQSDAQARREEQDKKRRERAKPLAEPLPAPSVTP
jgi:hypothetical protein